MSRPERIDAREAAERLARIMEQEAIVSDEEFAARYPDRWAAGYARGRYEALLEAAKEGESDSENS